MHNKAIVVGAGIVGLATAKALAEKGWKVDLYERNPTCVGASIRNFGMVWPIGQPSGHLYQRAQRSREIWKQVCQSTNSWFEESGSLHLAQTQLEWTVLQELGEKFGGERPVQLLNCEQLSKFCPVVNQKNVLGAIWSHDEMLVEAREVIRHLPAYLQDTHGVGLHFQALVQEVGTGYVKIGQEKKEADLVCICSGSEMELLFPQAYADHFTKCQLQMMRLVQQPAALRLGPAICGGLSLLHYKSFSSAPSLPDLRKAFESSHSAYLDRGIHVMAAQNKMGEITVGDSHDYAQCFDPFDLAETNQLVLNYLQQLIQLGSWDVIQTWNGVYSKRTNGDTEFVKEIEPQVWLLNALGGAGMTLSFGLAEEFVSGLI